MAQFFPVYKTHLQLRKSIAHWKPEQTKSCTKHLTPTSRISNLRLIFWTLCCWGEGAILQSSDKIFCFQQYHRCRPGSGASSRRRQMEACGAKPSATGQILSFYSKNLPFLTITLEWNCLSQNSWKPFIQIKMDQWKPYQLYGQQAVSSEMILVPVRKNQRWNLHLFLVAYCFCASEIRLPQEEKRLESFLMRINKNENGVK